MVEIKADKSKNLLKISFSRHVGPDELKNSGEKLKAFLTDLQPGFVLLTDLSGLGSMEVACAAHLKRTMDWCDQKGVARVIRVIPDPHKDIGLNIMSLFHYRHGIPIVTCESLKEAMAILAD